MQWQIGQLAQATPDYRSYIERIKEAVRDGRTSVTLDPAVLATPLVYTILQEPLGSATSTQFDIRPLAALALRGMV